MLSLLAERQVLPCCYATRLEARIAKLVKSRKRKKIPFAKLLKHNSEVCQHILLGFTSDGEHLLSCCGEVDEDFDDEEVGDMFPSSPLGRCTLHWWRLPLRGYTLKKVQEMSVFDSCVYNSNYSLEVVEVPGTACIISHAWRCTSTRSAPSPSNHSASDVKCALSVTQNPLKQDNLYQVIITYSKSVNTAAIPLPLAVALPGCVIIDLTYCICVVCYDSVFAECYSSKCSQPWLVNRVEKYTNCVDSLVVWETVTVHVRCGDQVDPCGTTLPVYVSQQVLDIEKWLVSELSNFLEDQGIGFHFIKDYLVHIQEVCSVMDTISLLLQALVNARHSGRVKCYRLQISGVWDVKKGVCQCLGEIYVQCKTFSECLVSEVLKPLSYPSVPNHELIVKPHHLMSAPVTTGSSLCQLPHPFLPLDIVLSTVTTSRTREYAMSTS